MPVTHILFATDLNDTADAALELAMALADSYGAKLTLLHATPTPSSAFPPYARGWYWPTDEITRETRKLLDKVLERVRKEIPTATATMATGDPHEAILKHAKDDRIDLIVMGTHGRRAVSRILFGSVAERVVRLSPIPVLTVH